MRRARPPAAVPLGPARRRTSSSARSRRSSRGSTRSRRRSKAHPDEVHLTVGVVRYDATAGRPCKGVASTFLAEPRAARAEGRGSSSSRRTGSRCPTDGDTPMIMVGPGTGIAPFRAFLAGARRPPGPRARTGSSSATSARDFDFLYEDELEDYQQRRRPDPARHRLLPRPGGEGLRPGPHAENGAELWGWLQEGAHFYVCGDAKRMATDVDHALQQIVAEQGGHDRRARRRRTSPTWRRPSGTSATCIDRYDGSPRLTIDR